MDARLILGVLLALCASAAAAFDPSHRAWVALL